MLRMLLIFSALLLSACQGFYQQRPDIVTYRQTQQISHDEDIVNWRRAKGIPLSASIAITSNNEIAVLEKKTRPYIIAPTLDPYNNDFAPCYLRREAFIAGKHVTLEVPCEHASTDGSGSGFNHRSGSPFPGANFDVSTLNNIK